MRCQWWVGGYGGGLACARSEALLLLWSRNLSDGRSRLRRLRLGSSHECSGLKSGWRDELRAAAWSAPPASPNPSMALLSHDS